ncbi:MAG: 30S ribosomal protein S8 [Solirubrobacterales bacterium]|jgi:small subunit ribosomal protein S8|nr:30S ribosomal protein S8 [Solirubrobacterales bacterium]
MSMTDPVADLLTRVRNGAHAQHHEVFIPASHLKHEIARILKEQGYIESFAKVPAPEGEPGERIRIVLRYTEDRKPIITGIRRVSRPGRRYYVDHNHIPKVQGGLGTAIISTSHGVMTGHEARRAGVGGEVVAHVW